MTRPAGSKNKSKFVQDSLPNIPYEEVCELPENNNQIQEKEMKMAEKMTEIKHVVRTVSRSNVTSYVAGQIAAVSMTETEMYLSQLLSSGWQLFSVHMLNQNDKTFDMLYVLVK